MALIVMSCVNYLLGKRSQPLCQCGPDQLPPRVKTQQSAKSSFFIKFSAGHIKCKKKYSYYVKPRLKCNCGNSFDSSKSCRKCQRKAGIQYVTECLPNEITYWTTSRSSLALANQLPVIILTCMFFADLKLGIIDMYLKRLKERQHRKK